MYKIFLDNVIIKCDDKILNNATKIVVDNLTTTCEDQPLNNKTTINTSSAPINI